MVLEHFRGIAFVRFTTTRRVCVSRTKRESSKVSSPDQGEGCSLRGDAAVVVAVAAVGHYTVAGLGALATAG